MSELLFETLQKDIRTRQQRIEKLDTKVLKFTRGLIRDETKNYESLVDNEYFLKISQPGFTELSTLDQLMYLALWFCERSRSASDNRFSFECQKEVNGQVVTFLVSLQIGEQKFNVALEYGAKKEKQETLEKSGLPVLNYTPMELWRRPLEIAEEVFDFLDKLAESISPS